MDQSLSVVVIGTLHHNTLGVVRAIGEAGIRKKDIFVVLTNTNRIKNNYIGKSRYVDKHNFIFVPEVHNLVNELLKLAEDGRTRTIICCSDDSSEIVISAEKLLSKHYHMPHTLCNIAELMRKDTPGYIGEGMWILSQEFRVLKE